MSYLVRALRGETVITVQYDVLTEAEARKTAVAENLLTISVNRRADRLWRRRQDSGRFSLLLFSQELLALLEAGLSVVEAIEALAEKEKKTATKSVLSSILARLREGKRLSVALQDFGEVFPPLYIGIVAAAERTSSLEDALGRFVEYQTRVESVGAKIISALIS
jgi:general secretion pathway protein F